MVPATATFDEVMALKPDGIFLSNGPGDPAATGDYAVPVIQRAARDAASRCSASASATSCSASRSARRTTKMLQGHRGANHPVKRLSDGAVEITSMNHGFAVERDSLPANVARDARLAVRRLELRGCELTDKPAFSVQYHPEASPGPQDSFYLFERFVEIVGGMSLAERRACTALADYVADGCLRSWQTSRLLVDRYGELMLIIATRCRSRRASSDAQVHLEVERSAAAALIDRLIAAVAYD